MSFLARSQRSRALAACLIAALLTAGTLLLSGCSADDDNAADDGVTDSTTTATPTTEDASAEPTPLPYRAEVAIDTEYLEGASEFLVDLDLIPGQPEEAVVLDQRGQIYRIALDGSFAPQSWGDLRDRVAYDENEQGLLSLAFSPGFEEDGRVYIYYTQGSPEPSVLGRFQATAEALDEASEERLIEIDQHSANHNGGTLIFDDAGYLMLSLGDGGGSNDPAEQAQDLTVLNGSVLRIDVSPDTGYEIPPDNPFADGPGGNRDEIWAYGFRNPWRMSVDSLTGDVWLGDVGEGLWEEVDHVIAGGNYGWDCYQGPAENEIPGEPDQCTGKEFVAPLAEYNLHPGSAVTGGLVYRGQEFPELYGRYLYADFYKGVIWALDTENLASEPVQLTEDDIYLASFTELPDGEFLIVSYSQGIYKLARN